MIRRIVVAVAALGLLPLVAAVPAQALPSCGVTTLCTTFYYSDRYLTIQVGYWSINCEGRVSTSGRVTPYQRYITRDCRV